MKFPIPCIHETKGIPASETVANHHPLTLEEVSMLIQLAYALRTNDQKVADIQERLRQGIMGMTCPQPAGGEIGRRIAIIDKLFTKAMENYCKPPIYPLLALQLFENMLLETDAEMYAGYYMLFTKSIDELKLSIRSYNILKINGIKTIGELTRKTEAEMLRMRNMGRKRLNEIKDALCDIGLLFDIGI
jgi:hypothetical protein